MGTIYLLTNLVNGKYYVGQTVQPLYKRLDYHFYGPPGCPLLSKAIKKYGKKSFVVDVLAKADSVDELNILEALWIAVANSTCRSVGYNINPGGKSSKQAVETIEKRRQSMMGHSVSAETRRKQSEIAMAQGRRPTESAIHNSANARRGKPFGRPRQKGQVAWNKGIPSTPEAIEKSRRARIGLKQTAESNAKRSASLKAHHLAKFLAPQ